MHVLPIAIILSEGAVENRTFLFIDDCTDLPGRNAEEEKHRGSGFHLIAFNINAEYHNNL